MRGVVRWIERFLFAIGLVILGYCGAAWLNSRVQQAKGNHDLDRLLSNQTQGNQAAIPEVRIPEGDLVGKVEIPDLRLSAVIFQGTEDGVLDHGVGHLEGSALPGQPGNVVLAAHRDTFFRSLRNIRKGEVVRVTTASGTRTYAVESTEVVAPTQVSVMDPTPAPSLTLITCYPFYYVGHAPKRFIVRARDMEARIQPQVASRPQVLAKKFPPATQLPGSEDKQNLTYIFKASE